MLAMLIATPKPAEANVSCIEGCVNQLTGDLDECKWWLLKDHYSESSYSDCVGAAASHAEVCVNACNAASGGKNKIATPEGPYKWYSPGDLVTLSAGLQEDSTYIHGVGPTAHVEAYLLDLYGSFNRSTPFQDRNWLPVGSATFDGDSLWQVQVDMSAFPSTYGYLVRYDFTLQNDTTYTWVSSLVSRSIITAVPVGSSPTLARLAYAPNPANDKTRISFNVPKAGPVSVTIYDVLGRRIRSWSWSNMSAGEHQITWNWESSTGRDAPSTVVFCRLTVGGESIAHRMIRL